MAEPVSSPAEFLSTEEAISDYFALLRTRTPENYLIAQAFLDPVLFPEQTPTPTEDIAYHVNLFLRHGADMDYEDLAIRGRKVATVYSLLFRVVLTPAGVRYDHLADVTNDAAQTITEIDTHRHLSMTRRKELLGVMNEAATSDSQTVRMRALEVVRNIPPAGVRGAIQRYITDFKTAAGSTPPSNWAV